MKKIAVLLAVIASVFITKANAQNGTLVVGWNLPRATVEIINNTEDYTPIGPVVDGSQDRKLLQRGSIFKRSYYQSAFGYGGPQSVAFEIYACRSLTAPENTVFPDPPQWSMDAKLVGGLALTRPYLAADPGERMLQARVKSLERILNDRGELGRKDMIKDLEVWHKGIRKTGTRQTDEVCANNSQILTGTLDVTQYYGKRTILINVTGDRVNGYTYRITGQ